MPGPLSSRHCEGISDGWLCWMGVKWGWHLFVCLFICIVEVSVAVFSDLQ